MKSAKLLNGLLIWLGLLLLFEPLILFHWHSDLHSKLTALKYLTVSLLGLALVTLALWSGYCLRRAQDEDV